MSRKCQGGEHKASSCVCPHMHKCTQCWKTCIVQIYPDALLLAHSIYWIEFSFNLHLNLTLATLTIAQGAFIAPHFVISQLFMSILNTNGLTPPAAARWEHFRHPYCSQAQSVWVLKFDSTLFSFFFLKPVTKTKDKAESFATLLTDALSPLKCSEV